MALFARFRLPLAIAISLTAGYLLLPEHRGLDLPLLPEFDKHSIPVLTVLAILFKRFGWAKLRLVPSSTLLLVLLSSLVIGAFLTVLSNGDSYSIGSRTLPGLSLYDSFSSVLTTLIMLLPFLLGYRFLAGTEQHRALLVVLVAAGVGYSFPALFEVRMSPQLNQWIYGYFQSTWAYTFRAGGWRPVVFVKNGLFLSLFFACTIVAAAGLARFTPKGDRTRYVWAALWLLFTLVMCKSLGALLITLVIAPVIFLMRPRGQLFVTAAIAAIILSYPILRAAEVVPADAALNMVAKISEERAASFELRVVSEATLLEKAQQRPLFGWGGWGRSRIFDEKGNDITVPDGYWVITIGEGGWLRYLGEFSLLCLPLILLALRCRRLGLAPETAVLALTLSANLIDLIPNSGITVLTWLMAVSLWGRLGQGPETETPVAGAAEEPKTLSRYSRQTRRIHRSGIPAKPAPSAGAMQDGRARGPRGSCHSIAQLVP